MPADGARGNQVDTGISPQDNQQPNAAQQKSLPSTLQEMGKSEPDPGEKGFGRPEKTQEELHRGGPARSLPAGDQGKASASEAPILPEQQVQRPRGRNDGPRQDLDPGDGQAPAAPAADVVPQRALAPAGQSRSLAPQQQDQQIKASGDAPQGKKQPRKPGEPEEEEGQQGLPPK